MLSPFQVILTLPRVRYSTFRMVQVNAISSLDVWNKPCSHCVPSELTYRLLADYDLVRVHHPDSPHCRHLDPTLRHKRFQAITAAYASLSGKSRGGNDGGSDALRAELRRRRAYQDAQRRYERHTMFHNDVHGFGRPRADWNAHPDDRWKDWAIICVGVVVRR